MQNPLLNTCSDSIFFHYLPQDRAGDCPHDSYSTYSYCETCSTQFIALTNQIFSMNTSNHIHNSTLDKICIVFEYGKVRLVIEIYFICQLNISQFSPAMDVGQ